MKLSDFVDGTCDEHPRGPPTNKDVLRFFYFSKEDKTHPGQFNHYLDTALRTSYNPCHQQAVERVVALMSTAKLKCAEKAGNYRLNSEHCATNTIQY